MAFPSLVFKCINMMVLPGAEVPVSVSSATIKTRQLISSSKPNRINSSPYKLNSLKLKEGITIAPGRPILSSGGRVACLPTAPCYESVTITSGDIDHFQESEQGLHAVPMSPTEEEIYEFYNDHSYIEETTTPLTRVNSSCSTVVSVDNDAININISDAKIDMDINVNIDINVSNDVCQDRPEIHLLEETEESKYQIISDNDDDGLDSDEEGILNDIMDSRMDYMSVATSVINGGSSDDSGTMTLVGSSDYGGRSNSNTNTKRLNYYRAFSIRSKQISISHKINVVLFVILVVFKNRESRRRVIAIVQKATQELEDQAMKTASLFARAKYFICKRPLRRSLASKSGSRRLLSPIMEVNSLGRNSSTRDLRASD